LAFRTAPLDLREDRVETIERSFDVDHTSVSTHLGWSLSKAN
jgi:hypothetical protein